MSQHNEIADAVRRVLGEINERFPACRLAYSAEDAAELSKRPLGVVRNAISRGHLPARKCGQRWMILRAELIRWSTLEYRGHLSQRKLSKLAKEAWAATTDP